MQKKENYSGVKYEQAEWINNMKRELGEFEEGLEANIYTP